MDVLLLVFLTASASWMGAASNIYKEAPESKKGAAAVVWLFLFLMTAAMLIWVTIRIT